METKGLMAALLKLKTALKGAALPEINSVKTFAGVVEAQKAVDGRSADYQTWLDYALNADLKHMIESQYSGDTAVDVCIHDTAIPDFIQQFHCTVVESIHKLAGNKGLMNNTR